MMHKTATVDYIIVLKGEIHAIMDKGETLLKAGDILVQRGTNHSWSVRGSEPCIIAAVLVSAAPLGAKKRKAAKRARQADGEAKRRRNRRAARRSPQPGGARAKAPAAHRPTRASSSPTAAAGRPGTRAGT